MNKPSPKHDEFREADLVEAHLLALAALNLVGPLPSPIRNTADRLVDLIEAELGFVPKHDD
jgi:hypothetical protein